MYVHSVKLINYKSIGEYSESEIILEPKVTAIIGKNESGKSNVLEGLSRINFLSPDPNAFSDDLANRSNGSPIKYILVREILSQLHRRSDKEDKGDGN